MVCDTLIHHPSLNRLVSFLETTNGREKSLRLLQYLINFILANRNLKNILLVNVNDIAGSKKNILLYKQLQAQISIVRKFLRFLKPISITQALVRLYNTNLKQSAGNAINPDFVINFAKSLFSNLYLTLDQLNLLRMLNILPTNEFTGTRLPKITNYCWLFGIVANLVSDIKLIFIVNKKLQYLSEQSKSQDEKEYENESVIKSLTLQKQAAVKKLIWDLLDLSVVTNSLNLMNLNQNGYASLAGVITSYFGIQDVWNKIPASTK